VQSSPTTAPEHPIRQRDEFLRDLKFLCAGQNVDDVFVASMGLMMSSVQQRCDSKDMALEMLDVTLSHMRDIVDANYDDVAAREASDGLQ
jgi:hypothetical protein